MTSLPLPPIRRFSRSSSAAMRMGSQARRATRTSGASSSCRGRTCFGWGFKYGGARMAMEEADEASWDVGLFLQLGTQCHPLILETFVAPVVATDDGGEQLRHPFPHLWSSPAPMRPLRTIARISDGRCSTRRMIAPRSMPRPTCACPTTSASFSYGRRFPSGLWRLRSVKRVATSNKEGRLRLGEVIDQGEDWPHEAARHSLEADTRPTMHRSMTSSSGSEPPLKA